MATGFAEIESDLTTHRVHPTANDIASTAGKGKRAAEPELTALLNRILDDSDWIISGFDYSSGSVLNATFNGGESLIEGRHIFTTGTFVVALEDDATNHIWLTWTESSDLVTQLGIHNATSDTPPSTPYAKIATVTTSGGSIDSNTDERATNRTLAVTISTPVQASITTMASLTTVGALNAGSITSGFGAIDIGVSAFEGGSFTASGSTSPSFYFVPSSGATTNGQIHQTGDLISMADAGVANWFQVDIANGTVKILDPANTDWLAINHDGTDINLVGTNTTDFNFSGATAYNFAGVVAPTGNIEMSDDLVIRWGSTNGPEITGSNASDYLIFRTGGGERGRFNASGIEITGVAYMAERAAALGDTAGLGQFWVKDDAPNVPMFTGDTGVDLSLLNTREITIEPNIYTDGDVQFATGSVVNAVSADGVASMALLQGTNDYVTYTFVCPHDYVSVNSALLYCSSADTTEATLNFRAELTTAGEQIGGLTSPSGGTVNSIAASSTWFSEAAWQTNTFDIAALFASMVAGDLVSVGIRWSATANAAYMGPIKFRYN